MSKKKTYFQSREILSKQMLKYDPRKQSYPRDERMPAVTSLTKAARKVAAGKNKCSASPTITATQLKKAKRYGTSQL
eukprot:3398624-Ditylum_brightwellii.AAC.1